jgi:peroxiredoxin
MPSLRLIASTVIALLLLCLADGCAPSVQPGAVKAGRDRHPAPDFELKDAEGKAVRLSDYKGKVVLLDFWATNCGPCRTEIPWFIELERTRKDQGFEALGVSLDEHGWTDVKPYVAEMKMNYRVVMGDETVALQYGDVEAIPTTFLIDRQGRIAAVHVGVDTGRKEFANAVDSLLGENDAR